MLIVPRSLEGSHVRLQAVDDPLRDEMKAALDCDPGNWAIQLANARGADFAAYWTAMIETPGRLSFAIYDVATGRLAGTSSMIDIDAQHRTLEIGYTWFRPEFRGTAVNPEAKLIMLREAFGAGALRVQFSVDARNARSQAAMLKLGAVPEGVVRRHKITWTGHHRDTVRFSILDAEWPDVRAKLQERLKAIAASSPRGLSRPGPRDL